jgi:hypothetical protein
MVTIRFLRGGVSHMTHFMFVPLVVSEETLNLEKKASLEASFQNRKINTIPLMR